ncbi:dr1-associated corepressor, partial [Myiozetetes cayanensis]|uniref:dr1-associated corepressor n=1 Tax=Myiozetetes cayanensis TaxID=478635 RepID=UPI00215E233C
MTTSHLKQCIELEQQFDFLKDLLGGFGCTQVLPRCYPGVPRCLQVLSRCYPGVPRCYPGVIQVLSRCLQVLSRCYPGVIQVLSRCFSPPRKQCIELEQQFDFLKDLLGGFGCTQVLSRCSQVLSRCSPGVIQVFSPPRKQCIELEQQFDFLKDLVAAVPDMQGDGDDPHGDGDRGPRRGRRPGSGRKNGGPGPRGPQNSRGQTQEQE